MSIYIYKIIFICFVPQSCPTLCDLMDCSPPGCSVHGIFPGRILEWVAISFSRGSLWPRDWTHVSRVSCTGRQILHCWATEEALYICIYMYIKYVHIPWRRERLPTPVFWPREFCGLYGPWGCKESDMTECLSPFTHTHINIYIHTHIYIYFLLSCGWKQV